jgi:hypothetical protein
MITHSMTRLLNFPFLTRNSRHFSLQLLNSKGPTVNFKEFPELEESCMKIVGKEVDRQSPDFRDNYEKMMTLN